jgi:FkbM family methyltransferase
MKKILIYAGANIGKNLLKLSKNFDECYAFEASPDVFKRLKANTENQKNIYIFNVALTVEESLDTVFYTYDGMPASGSISSEMCDRHIDKVKGIKKHTVPAVNLMNFLKEKNINHISHFFSDLQGMDFSVLQTLEPLITEGKVDKITCEVEQDNKENHYKDLTENRRCNFDNLLKDKYIISSIIGPKDWITNDITWVRCSG